MHVKICSLCTSFLIACNGSAYGLTDGDILGLFDSSSDELDLEQSDEDIDFEPDLTENLSESSSSHELSFLMTEIWKLIVLMSLLMWELRMLMLEIHLEMLRVMSMLVILLLQTVFGSPYAPINSDLLKLPFTFNNPGISLPTSGQYENELSYFQLYFTDNIITEFVHETNTNLNCKATWTAS